MANSPTTTEPIQYAAALQPRTVLETKFNRNLDMGTRVVTTRNPTEILRFSRSNDSRIPTAFQFHDELFGTVALESGETVEVVSDPFNHSELYFLDVARVYSRDEVGKPRFFESDWTKSIRSTMDRYEVDYVVTWKNSLYRCPYDPEKDHLVYSRYLASRD